MGYIVPNMGYSRSKARPPRRAATGIADTLFTKSRQRVLAVVFGNPARTFYANEIIRLAGVGTGAVQRELESLAASGLVIVTRVGNQKHYQANAASPVFASLSDLVLKTSGLADVLRAALAQFGTEIQASFVFGSIAKREDRSGSYVDLFVVSDTLGYAQLFSALEPAAARLGRSVTPTVYSTEELARRIKNKNAFVSRVLAQPKIWIIGGDDDLAT